MSGSNVSKYSLEEEENSGLILVHQITIPSNRMRNVLICIMPPALDD